MTTIDGRTIDDQSAVVIGGTSGIGLATALLLARQGMRVWITGRDPGRVAEAGAAISAALGSGGRSRSWGESVVADASDAGAVSHLLDRVTAESGTVDHLVLAASGGSGGGAFRDLDLSALRSGFDGKLWPHLTTMSAALPYLTANGSITLVTAISAASAEPGTAGLAAINGALEAMVPTLAVELAPARVNAVSPDDIATAIAFLIANTFITGVVLPVDGGLRLV